MVDSSTAYSMMNTAGAPATQANPYGPASSPYAPGAGAVGDIVSALMGYIKNSKNPGGLGTFEGNVASPANPLNDNTYGMPSQGADPSMPAAAPQAAAPQAPQAPASIPQVNAPAPQTAPAADPFSQGATPTPYIDPSMSTQANPFNQDPFSQGALAVPYTDPTMSALFSQPPTG